MHSTKNMMITAPCDDLHAIAVQIAASELGHSTLICVPADFPENAFASWELGEASEPRCSITNPMGTIDLPAVDCHWFRRPDSPSVSTPLEPADKKMAMREATSLLVGLRGSLDNAFNVNPIHQAYVGEDKVAQLRHARRVGLQIPRTLISNDPDKIKAFIETNEPVQTVYKPFRGCFWKESDGVFSKILTTPITRNDLVDDAILRLTPGIFQEQVAKRYEVRITIMGDHIIPVKLHSSDTNGGRDDWRGAVVLSDLRPEITEVPYQVARKCKAFLRSMELVFGCIDMIVTTEGKYIFLENNQAGQFLWLEKLNADIKMLDPFVKFLASENSTFTYKSKQSSISYADIAVEIDSVVEKRRAEHTVHYAEDRLFALQ